MAKKEVMRKTTDHTLYSFICKNPGLSTYEIEKRLRWNGGKVRRSLNRLERSHLIKAEYIFGPRTKKIVRPAPWQELVAWQENNKKEKLLINSKASAKT